MARSHNYKDCIKCSGTGEYEQVKANPSKPNEVSPMKTVLIWLCFFAVIPLLVYAVIFFERVGVETEVAIFALSAASWIIIYQSIQKLILNSRKPKYERLVFFDPDKSLISNILGFGFIVAVALPVIALACYPLIWLVN